MLQKMQHEKQIFKLIASFDYNGDQNYGKRETGQWKL